MDQIYNYIVYGIQGWGTYVPYRRLDRSQIASVTGTHGGSETRAVAGYDEDSTTMGVEAPRRASHREVAPPPSGSPPLHGLPRQDERHSAAPRVATRPHRGRVFVVAGHRACSRTAVRACDRRDLTAVEPSIGDIGAPSWMPYTM